jgi:rubrerythrin
MSDEDAPEVLSPETRTAATELVWRCSRCGLLRLRDDGPPDRCPDCGAPREDFYLVTED